MKFQLTGPPAVPSLVVAIALALATSACSAISRSDPVAEAEERIAKRGCDTELLYQAQERAKKQLSQAEDAADLRRLMDGWLAQAGCTHRDLNEMTEHLDVEEERFVGFEIGRMYAYGSGYLITDEERGFNMLQRAAWAGYARAQITMTDLFLRGIGTPRSKGAALAWCWLFNTAEVHRVYEARNPLWSRKVDCGELIGPTSREQRRQARKWFDELYRTSRSTDTRWY